MSAAKVCIFVLIIALFLLNFRIIVKAILIKKETASPQSLLILSRLGTLRITQTNKELVP